MSKDKNRITKKQAEHLRNLRRISLESALGGENTVSYLLLADFCKYVMRDEFRTLFGTDKLSKLPSCRYRDAQIFFGEWFPDDRTMEKSVLYEEAFSKFIYRFCEEPDKNSAAYRQLMEDFVYAVCSGTEGS